MLVVVTFVTYGVPRILRPDRYPGEQFISGVAGDVNRALLLGIVVGLVAPVGDLFESKVKRDAGTKDAGTLFGPHGGALDRLDAALFSLVAGYYVWLLLL